MRLTCILLILFNENAKFLITVKKKRSHRAKDVFMKKVKVVKSMPY